jgi:hypothetical protein
MRWAEHVARMGKIRKAYKILVGIDVGADVRIILKWIEWKSDGKVWIGFIWPRIGTNNDLL